MRDGGDGAEAAKVRRDDRRRVLILGGGMAGLTTAWDLTASAALRERFEVTVLSPGWRLGGKGASGANLAEGGRTEEHGLHVWFGFYEHAFRVVREAYAELERPVGHPLAHWTDAFTPTTRFCYHEVVEHDVVRWPAEFPVLPGSPGDGSAAGDWGSALVQLTAWLERGTALLRAEGPQLLPFSQRLERMVRALVPTGRPLDLASPRRAPVLVPILRGIRAASRRTLTRHWGTPKLRMIASILDLFTTVFIGLHADDLARRGLGAIDDEELLAWLRRHGAAPELLRTSPILTSLYDATFGFRGGDPDVPDMAAGVGLRAFLRMLFAYKGALAYRMNGGMGDIVFVPLYRALERRGVKFAFFHEATALRVSGDRVSSVEVSVQARSRTGSYAPLVELGGVERWPSTPLWDQLEDSPCEVDLEHGSPPSSTPQILRLGEDFDDVVLAAPAGVHDRLCRDLAAHPRWAAYLASSRTVATQAMQVWFDETAESLGVREPISGTCVGMFDTFADMSAALEWEAPGPKHLAYSCGVLPDAVGARGVGAHADELLRSGGRAGFPGFYDDDGPRWSALHDPRGRTGSARAAAQYVRANVAPADRYSLSPPGSIRHRIRADRTGFANLVVAGDWTDCGYNVGCIEAATLSGRLAAQALTGDRTPLVGADDTWVSPLAPRRYGR